MRHFGSAVPGRGVYCRLDAARLEQTRANLIKAELLGSGFAPLNADHVRSVFHRLTDRLPSGSKPLEHRI